MAYIKAWKVEESGALIGTNSEVFKNGDLVAIVGGFLTKAIASVAVPVVGASNTTSTMASNNQTVAFEKVPYTRFEPYDTRFDYVTTATITQADIGKYYNTNAAGDKVDVATANAAKQAASKVRLEGIVSGTVGTFVAVV